MIVALPLSSTSTLVPSGNLPLLASSIFFLTSSFSLSVNLSRSFTPVFSGTFGVILSACVSSEPLSSLPFSCPFTGTSNVCDPFGRSLSVTVTLIGPSTFVPGVTTILPFSSILAGTSFPSSSFATTFVVSSGFLTTKPIFCSSSVGSTGVTFPVI